MALLSRVPDIVIGLSCFTIAHILTFYQLNGQFLEGTDWFRKNVIAVAAAGMILSFFYIWGTKYTVAGTDGLLWPARFIGFSIGMFFYAILVNFHFSQGIDLKTIVSLLLCLVLISIQFFWK